MRKQKTYSDNDAQFHWQVFRQLWPFLLEYKQRVILALLCLVAAKVASVGLPFVLKEVVDTLNSPQNTLVVVPIALLIAYGLLRLFNTLLGEIRDTLFGRVTERAMRRIGLKVFDHLHTLELAFHLDRQTGGISRDIERGSSGISFLMRFMVFNIGPTLLEIAMVVGLLLFNYGVAFAIIILIAVSTYVTFSVKATNWRTRFVKQMNFADSNTHTRAIDSLLNFETVKYFNNEDYESKRYDINLAEWETARRKNRLSLFALNGGQALIIASAMTAMMFLAAQGVAANEMTIGDFVLINTFTMQLFLPLNFLGFVYREIRGSLANIENLFSLLERTPEIRDEVDAKHLLVDKGRVTFDEVHFAYSPERQVIKGLSFSVEPGTKVAIVGESGAGKSSLVKCLFRFYDIDQGTIRIDGQNIKEVTQQSLRQHLGIVPQDTVLFNDTLKENILYGKTDATEADITRVLKLAYLDQFVASLPEGLNTRVGERGLKLSGGEKQRVAIARALLKNPTIMIFDEATSSLDSESEQAILSALKNAAKDHTTLVIAHRLSTIIDADKIVVIKDGKAVEQGDHLSLLAKDGRYAALWKAQQHEDS